MTNPDLANMESVASWLTEQSGRPTHSAGDVRSWSIPGPDGVPKITVQMSGPNGRNGIRARDSKTDEPVPFRNLEALKALIQGAKEGA